MQKSFLYFLSIYFFNPFFAFLYSLKYHDKKWFKNALWMFVIFFGFSMSFLETIDAFEYKRIFESSLNFNKNINSFIEIFNTKVTGQVDFATSLIIYFLSKFTSNYHVLFGVYGLIFGYFYSRNIDFVLKISNRKNLKSITGLVLFLAIYIGIWQINGFRFWTASHIFMWGLINFIYLKNTSRGVVFIIISSAVHFSFVLPLLIFFIYNFIPKYNKLFITLVLLLSIYNPLSDLRMVEDYLKMLNLTEQIESKVEVYTSEDVLERLQQSSINTNPFKILNKFFNLFFIMLLAWIVREKYKDISKEESLLLHYGLILAVTGALLSFVPSLGRFLNLASFIILYSVVVSILKGDLFPQARIMISKIGYLSVLMFIPANLWIISTFSLHTIAGNYATVLVDDSDILYSLWDILIFIVKEL